MKNTKIFGAIIILTINLSIALSIIYFFYSGRRADLKYENCNISMSDDEIKSFSVAYARENLRHVDPDGFTDWEIIETTPLTRRDAESEFDMVKYEVKAEGAADIIELMIGRCKNVINFSWDKK